MILIQLPALLLTYTLRASGANIHSTEQALLALFDSRLFIPHDHCYKHAALVYTMAYTSGVDLQDIVDPLLFFLANQKPLSEIV